MSVVEPARRRCISQSRLSIRESEAAAPSVIVVAQPQSGRSSTSWRTPSMSAYAAGHARVRGAHVPRG
eukprot:2750755-Prymnesium_polylepis.1